MKESLINSPLINKGSQHTQMQTKKPDKMIYSIYVLMKEEKQLNDTIYLSHRDTKSQNSLLF